MLNYWFKTLILVTHTICKPQVLLIWVGAAYFINLCFFTNLFHIHIVLFYLNIGLLCFLLIAGINQLGRHLFSFRRVGLLLQPTDTCNLRHLSGVSLVVIGLVLIYCEIFWKGQYPNGKGVGCKPTEMFQSWFDSSLSLMFRLMFSYLNQMQKPFLQSKLNIWELRQVNQDGKVLPLLEYLISTSNTFKTKFIAVSPLKLTYLPVWLFFLYHTLLLILWIVL